MNILSTALRLFELRRTLSGYSQIYNVPLAITMGIYYHCQGELSINIERNVDNTEIILQLFMLFLFLVFLMQMFFYLSYCLFFSGYSGLLAGYFRPCCLFIILFYKSQNVVYVMSLCFAAEKGKTGVLVRTIRMSYIFLNRIRTVSPKQKSSLITVSFKNRQAMLRSHLKIINRFAKEQRETAAPSFFSKKAAGPTTYPTCGRCFFSENGCKI